MDLRPTGWRVWKRGVPLVLAMALVGLLTGRAIDWVLGLTMGG